MSRLRAVLTLVLALPVSLALLAAPADAATGSAPFKDPNAVGKIGFCTKDGKPQTSGNVFSVPFAWKWVADTSAPKAYQGKPRGAAGFAFSPVKNTNPGDWNGYQMVNATQYDVVAHPVAQANYGEAPLDWHLGAYPVTWDGLVQLRMVYTAPNTPPRTQQYPAAIIRISGATWTLIDGDTNPDCAATGTNQVELLGTSNAIPTAEPSWAVAAVAKSQSQASQSPGTGEPSVSATSSDAAAAGGSSGENAAASGNGSLGSSAPIAIGALLILMVGGVVGAFIAGRRTSSTPE